MKVLIVIGQMLCGGSERVVYNLYRNIISTGHRVVIVVLGRVDYDSFPLLRTENLIIYSGSKNKGKVKSNYRKTKFIRFCIKSQKPDVILSFIDVTNVLSIMARRFIKIPLVISERNNPDCSKMSSSWFFLRNCVYRFADSLVVANYGLKKLCSMRFKVKRIDVIPNLINLKNIRKKSKKRIIAVGSLSQQKRFDLLVEAMHILKLEGRLKEYKLHIFGEGPEYKFLKKLIKEKELSDTVFLRGQSNRILDEYAASDIFVLSSDYEGQPNVLLEAMSIGLACISTRCDFGPEELIKNGDDGILVDTKSAGQLSSAIEKLITDINFREDMGRRAKIKIYQKFSEENLLEEWFKLFKILQKTDEVNNFTL